MSQTHKTVVEADPLVYRYTGGRDAFTLRSPALRIDAGEQVAVVGPSGCGKTTLASLLAGILVPSNGSVRVMGQEVSAMPAAERRAFRLRNIGFVFQRFELLDYLCGLDNILLPFHLARGVRVDRDAKHRARGLADTLGVSHLLKRHPHRMSQGERQRIAIARALVTQPKLVVADEPTGNLDPVTTRETLRLLQTQTRAANAAIVLITHDPEIPPMLDRTVNLGATAPR